MMLRIGGTIGTGGFATTFKEKMLHFVKSFKLKLFGFAF